ncbi:hypothetical protein [Peribacillus frigoritolerans]|uniref:hypothetical protein n=1 Tax=Peribacillus frigoritolerans TaxID=450367 RepID=UPI001E31D4C0|nr:hypothetical protein [Peribacillus frigoritolerans]
MISVLNRIHLFLIPLVSVVIVIRHILVNFFFGAIGASLMGISLLDGAGFSRFAVANTLSKYFPHSLNDSFDVRIIAPTWRLIA